MNWWKNLDTQGNKTRKTRKHTSSSKNRKPKRPAGAIHGDNGRKDKSQIQSSHTNTRTKNTIANPYHHLPSSSKSKRKRSATDGQEQRIDAHKTNSRIESPRPTKKRRAVSQITRSRSLPPDNRIYDLKASNEEYGFNVQGSKRQTANKNNKSDTSQVNNFQRFYSGVEPSASRSLKSNNIIERINGNIIEDEAGCHKPKPQTKRSHKANKSKLSRFRRVGRTLKVHFDTVSEPDTLEEPNQGSYITSKIDSGELLKDTRPLTISEPGVRGPQPSRSNAAKHTRNIGRTSPQLVAPNHRTLDDIFHKHDQPVSPRTQSEEREATLIQKFESQQRPREHVVPDHKWGYAVKIVESADIILDDEDRNQKAKTHRSFADRKKANDYLYKKTSADAVGGLEAIANRTTTLEGPERLLKVDIALTNGEHYLMWVERGLVVLDKLKERKRKQTQWQPTPRPKFPHYVVTCDLITYDTSLTTPSEDDDDDSMSLDEVGEVGSARLNIGTRVEKLPPMTFTIREMANEYAGKLFLRKTRVDKRVAEPSDVHWWQCYALPEHKKAVMGARGPGGLYELAMEVHDMNKRLGWNQILVHVHEVDDVTGPVNF